jgi:predicted nucleic acid-binding protein
MEQLLQLIQRQKYIFLDTSLFVYTFEQNPKFHDISKEIFVALSENKFQAITSLLTVTETLTIPYKNNDSERIQNYLEVFGELPNLSVKAPTLTTAIAAAKLRAFYNLKLPDAYQLAIAIENKCKIFLTNDKQLKKCKEIKVLCLSDFV